ncbi:MAG: ATP-dependent Clp protease adaptor ClpS [Planctomycetota bacterium]
MASDKGAAEAEVDSVDQDERSAPGRGREAGAAKPREGKQIDKLPPWAVVLHNDDQNSFEFVIQTLQKVLGIGLTHAVALTMRAHVSGRAVVWSGHRELAELKAGQITGRGADPAVMHRGAEPLRVTVEKMPG